ncbi:MAG TPA: uroporphyrinogen-III C-methyltransferase [Burkholderiaceae bacterium]|nr:uroporphyrinogen-III C-methyltransferase [Burkholderiaceae bacterium]
MNSSELPPSEPTPPVAHPPVTGAAPGEPPVAAPARASIGSKIAAAAVVLALAGALYAHYQLGALRRDSARRLGELTQATQQAMETANRADAEARAARERTALLEARLAEEQGQREALEQLYADLSRGRDEAVLVEVERLVAMASQELSISGNVATALAALQTADVRLARTDSARFLPLRRVIARDIERLKVAPTVDVSGMALKLDQIAAGVDTWPLQSEARPAAATPAPPKSPDVTAPSPGAPWWERWVEQLRAELGEYRDLVTLRRVDTPDSLLLQPQQQQLVRQQIRLRLLTARSALLMRNDRLFRADLLEAQNLIARYVDVRQPNVAAALGTLKQFGSTALSVDVPQINDSLAAVRAARVAPGR